MGIRSTRIGAPFADVFGRSRNQGTNASAGPSFSATGGTKVVGGDGYTYHVFLYPNSDSFVATGTKSVDYVVVAGGGGAGSGSTGNGSNHYGGGGGGAGGLRTGSSAVTTSTYPVTVGQGGAGNNTPFSGPTPGFGVKGSPSSIGFPSPVSCTGGGAGENRGVRVLLGGVPNPNPNHPGGSGGGSSVDNASYPAGTGIPGEGNPGGAPPPGSGQVHGGGGGAGGNGGNGSPGGPSGPGGNGSATNFPGPTISPAIPAPVQPSWIPAVGPTGIFAGGGGGGTGYNNSSQGSGGPGGGGGGGAGVPGAAAGVVGVDFTGGGGGGGSNYVGSTPGPSAQGGAGGHGIVIIRYLS